MTFSVVARCERTGMFGVAVSSSSPAVAARCAYAQAGVGAATSQNVTDPRLGPAVLARMATGEAATDAVAGLMRDDPHGAYRQVLCVDTSGNTGIHSGHQALGLFSDACGPNVACGGNMLNDAGVPAAMVAAFTRSEGHLAERLLLTMRAGLAAGGEAGPVHSAGLKVVHDVPWPVVDLRVDWSEGCPINDLGALWTRYAPQLSDYVARALNPGDAPSYGVPGDP